MKKILSALVVIFTITGNLSAQNYYDSINKIDSLNYFTKVKLIDSLYSLLPDSIKYAKESGYKDFERWRFFMGSRVDSTGFIDSFVNEYLYVQKKLSGLSKVGGDLAWCNGASVANWKRLGFSVKPPDNGQGWRNGLGWMRSIWVNPTDPDKMLAGSNMGGLWKTTDGGDSWISLSTDLFDGMGITAIAVHPTDPDIIYVAPSFGVRNAGAGIWKSTNGGSTWVSVFQNTTTDIRDIAINPIDPNIVYAIINNRVFRTFNGGTDNFSDEAWGIRTAFNPDTEDQANQDKYDWVDIEFETTGISSVRVHIVGTRYHMISDNNGNTYTGGDIPAETHFAYSNINNNGFNYVNDCQIAIRGNVKYRAYVANAENKLIIEKWNNSLNQWEKRLDIKNQTRDCDGLYSGAYNMGGRVKAVLEISSLNSNIVYIGGVKFFIYNDATQTLIGGSSRPFCSPLLMGYSGIHDDMRGISVVPHPTDANKEIIVIANDGGVTKAIIDNSSPTTIQFIDISNGLQVQQIHGLSINGETPSKVYTGHQDIGIIEYNGNDKQWSQSSLDAGDGGEVLIDPLDPTKMIWTLGGPPAFTAVSSNLDIDFQSNYLNAGTYNAEFVFTKNRNLYYGGQDGAGYKLAKYHDPFSSSYGAADETIFSYTFPNYFSALYVSPDEQTIYVAVEYANFTSKLFRSLNGGSTWQDYTQFVPSPDNILFLNMLRNTFITDIVGNPNNPDELYISFGYIDRTKPINARVVKTTNATDTWVNFTDWSTGLTNPNLQGIGSLPVAKLAYDELSDNHMIYAATDMGVYYRNDNSDNQWIRFSEGLPYAVSSDLILDRKEHRLLLATYGRGTWYTNIPCCEDSEPVATQLETNETWNTERVVNGIYSVPSGVTLTLENATFWFKPGSQIIVEPGGHLIINNALLTSYCTSFWGGIQVLGQASLESNNTNQGLVDMTNSTIQYAYRGIFCGDENDFSKNGGIVNILTSTFKDCRVGIDIYPYPSSGSYKSISKIRNSKFLASDELPDLTGHGMLHGVSVWGINGVRIEGNDFINSAPEKFNDADVYWETSTSHFRGNGVFGLDASFVIDHRTATGVHCTQTPTKYSSFEGLTNGIVLLNSTNLNARNSVINTSFKNCQTGINAIDDIYSKFYTNSFEWDGNFIDNTAHAYGFDYYANPSSSAISKPFAVGIYHNGSDGFLTENNSVTYKDDIDRNAAYNAFAFNAVKGTATDFAVRNKIINQVDAGATPKPLIIGKSLVGDCANLTLACNEYCDIAVDWYWLNNNTNLVSSQTGNSNNFTKPTSAFSIYNINYKLLSPGTGNRSVAVPNTAFSVTSNCSYSLPVTSYNYTPAIAPLPISTTCTTSLTTLCAAYKTTQVLPGDNYNGSLNPSVDMISHDLPGDKDGKREIIGLINAREYEKARLKLKGFNTVSSEDADFKTYYLLLISEYEKGNNLHKISNDGKAGLRLLGKNQTVCGGKARALLLGFYGEVVIPENPTIGDNYVKENDNVVSRNKFKIYPNPANSYVELSYEILEENLPSKVEIASSLGVVLYSSSLKYPKGTLTLLTDSWADGVYFVNINDGKSVLYSEKVVLIH